MPEGISLLEQDLKLSTKDRGQNESVRVAGPAVENREAERNEITYGRESLGFHNPNEDKAYFNKEHKFLAVLDGVSSSNSGDFASQIALDTFIKELATLDSGDLNVIAARMKKLMFDASGAIAASSSDIKWGQSTAVIAKLIEMPDGKVKAVIANAGDSRAYIYRAKEKRLQLVSLDDNLLAQSGLSNEDRRVIQQVVNASTSREDLYNRVQQLPETLRERAMQLYQFRNIITNQLGPRSIQNPQTGDTGLKRDSSGRVVSSMTEPQIYIEDLEDGDELILTSDGNHDVLTDEQIAEICSDSPKSKVMGIAGDHATKICMASDRITKNGEAKGKYDDRSAVSAKMQKVRVSQSGQTANEYPAETKDATPLTMSEEYDILLKNADRSPQDRVRLIGYKIEHFMPVTRAEIALYGNHLNNAKKEAEVPRQGGLLRKIENSSLNQPRPVSEPNPLPRPTGLLRRVK